MRTLHKMGVRASAGRDEQREPKEKIQTKATKRTTMMMLKKRKRRAARIGAIFASICGGALCMYLFDPDRGHARRARMRSRALGKGRRTWRRASRGVTRTAHYNAGRMRGAGHHLRSALPNTPHGTVDNVTLKDKVRSEVLGREPFSRADIRVDCYKGVAHLRGQLASATEIFELVSAVNAVEGVRRVESFLHTPGEVAPNKRLVMAAEASAANMTSFGDGSRPVT
jgi:BON domain